jgi:hypothetical protein
MKRTITESGLVVLLQVSPYPVVKNIQTKLKVTFIQVDTNQVQPHVDYDFIITKTNGTQIFQASALAGNPNYPLHTADGVVTIQSRFQESASILANVTIYGNDFVPIRPKSAIFPINVF